MLELSERPLDGREKLLSGERRAVELRVRTVSKEVLFKVESLFFANLSSNISHGLNATRIMPLLNESHKNGLIAEFMLPKNIM